MTSKRLSSEDILSAESTTECCDEDGRLSPDEEPEPAVHFASSPPPSRPTLRSGRARRRQPADRTARAGGARARGGAAGRGGRRGDAAAARAGGERAQLGGRSECQPDARPQQLSPVAARTMPRLLARHLQARKGRNDIVAVPATGTRLGPGLLASNATLLCGQPGPRFPGNESNP